MNSPTTTAPVVTKPPATPVVTKPAMTARQSHQESIRYAILSAIQYHQRNGKSMEVYTKELTFSTFTLFYDVCNVKASKKSHNELFNQFVNFVDSKHAQEKMDSQKQRNAATSRFTTAFNTNAFMNDVL